MPQGKGSEAIKRRKRSPLPWVVGIFVLLLGLWVVTLILGGENQPEDPAALTEPPADAPDPVVVPAPGDE